MGSERCPENKHERDVLLWLISKGLSKEMTFELSNDKKELPSKTRGLKESMFKKPAVE